MTGVPGGGGSAIVVVIVGVGVGLVVCAPAGPLVLLVTGQRYAVAFCHSVCLFVWKRGLYELWFWTQRAPLVMGQSCTPLVVY